MMLRTGKNSRYRSYTCSTKARQGEPGCRGRTAPWKRSTRSLPRSRDQFLIAKQSRAVLTYEKKSFTGADVQ
jgi:hypothetical protein